MMRLEDCELVRLMPEWMQDDADVTALSQGVDHVIRSITARIRLLTRWDKIDDLSDDELNAIAWELNIPWYEQEAPKSTKTAVIKHSDQVYSKLGTKYALESVLSDYFGTVLMKEWFEYGGQPYHFKLLTDNPEITNSKLTQFERLLRICKRRSTWLDVILVCLTGECRVFVGSAVEDHTQDQIGLGRKEIDEYYGVFLHEKHWEKFRLGKYLPIEQET